MVIGLALLGFSGASALWRSGVRFNGDWRGILGLSAAGLAFGLWALPADVFYSATSWGLKDICFKGTDCVVSSTNYWNREEWFTDERFPAVAASLSLSVILLLLRRR
jgi:hypothetical protein